MGGKKVYDFEESYQDPDTKDYIKTLLINTYNDAFNGENEFAYTLSAGMDIEVTFTVSGFAYDNPDAVPSGDTTPVETTAASTTQAANQATTTAGADAASQGGVSVGVIIAIVAAVVVVAAIVVVAVKKKK